MRNSGIVGITHEEDGAPMHNKSIVGRVALGKPAEDGRNYPTKIDYFAIKTKKMVDGDIEWPQSDGLMKMFDPDDHEPVEIPIMFVSDDPDEILFSQLQYWRQGEAGDGFLYCFGDGREAMRWNDEEERRIKYADPDDSDTPGECTCEFYTEEGKCDSRGYLHFQLLKPNGEPVEVGGLFSYQTTSAKIIRKLQGSIKTLKELLARPGQDWREAEIKGRRLVMKIDYMAHHYRDSSNDLRRGIVAYPYITLPIDDPDNPHDSLEEYRTDPKDISMGSMDSEPAEGGMVDPSDVSLEEDEAEEFLDDEEFADEDSSGEENTDEEGSGKDEPEEENGQDDEEPKSDSDPESEDDGSEDEDDEDWDDMDDLDDLLEE